MSTKWWTEDSSHRRPMKLVPVLLLSTSLLLASGCALLPKEQAEEVLPSINPPKLSKKPEYIVKTDTLETKVRGTGRLMALQEEELFFPEEMAGKRISSLLVKTGDSVEQDQPIALLDVSDLEGQLKQKRLQTRKDELTMIDTLRKADEMTAEQLEQAKIDFQLKREELNKLVDHIGKAQLLAPFSGTIVAVKAKKGDSLSAQSVATIADLNQLTIAASITADDAKKIAVGMEAVVDINSAGQHKGKVQHLPRPDPNGNNGNTGGGGLPGGQGQDSIDNYMVIQLNEFPPGMSRGTPLSVTVVTQKKENAVVIPLAALRSYSGRNYVQVVDNQGNKKEVDVEIGQQTATDVEIVKGLTTGQKVVGR